MNVKINSIFTTLDYKILHKQTPTIGTWDDHDYAINDGDGHFKHKEAAKQLFLDFIDEPRYSERRILDRGLFTTYTFGDPKTHKTVRLILLDVRYNKTSSFWDKDADILGEAQWKWLEDVLENNNETFTLIVSGTQILPFNRFLLFEAWYGRSRARLFDLLGRLEKNGVVLLTGDVHCAQILKTFCVLPELGYNLYEITSSGLSHYDRINFLLDYIMPNDYNILPSINYYNFAHIDFKWGARKNESQMEISIIDIDNVTRAKLTLNLLKDLSFDKSKIKDYDCEERLNSRFKSFGEYVNYYKSNKMMIPILFLYKWIFLIFVALAYLVYYVLNKLYRKIRNLFSYKYIKDISN